MKLLTRLVKRIRNLVSRQSGQERFLEEMQEHLIRLTEENIRLGMSPEEARRQAKLNFGAPGAIREQYQAEKSLPLIESAAQDVRYAARILRRSWGFTAIAATSLALAIGANTTIFSLMERVLLERLAVPHADQLRLLHWHGDRNVAINNIWGIPDPGSSGLGGTSFSYPAYEELRRDNRVLEDLFAFKDLGTVNATIEGNAQVVQVEAVSGNFFDQMQVQPELGRPVQAPDDRVGAPPVALISAGLWARVFGSSPRVLGRTVKLNMVPMTIIGVTPQGFTGAQGAQSAQDFFIPLSTQPLVAPWDSKGSLIGNSSPEVWWLNIMGRAKPGVSDATVQAALDAPLAALVHTNLQPGASRTIPRLDVQDGSRGLFVSKQKFARPVSVLMGLAALVLLLACSNIASLLLARSTARQREIAMRMALGAGRARVLRGVLTESLLLSALGGILGVA
ncbi:MAG: ABC transporter permease, partial [Terracidiphilus sp.]